VGASGPWRKKKGGSDVWHFCTNCSSWPTTDYETSYTKPTSGELDNECRSKEKAGTCS
jgi:hypothetical protein